MNKPNVFRSSSFYMQEDDLLHVILLGETGDVLSIELKSTLPVNRDIPGFIGDIPLAPTILNASDITATSFTANWYFNENTTGFYLSVATDIDFLSLVTGYNNLDVGNVGAYSITGLLPHTIYYYMIRPYNEEGAFPVISSSKQNITTLTLSASDWFLPSKEEMIATWAGAGLTGSYWTSSEINATAVYECHGAVGLFCDPVLKSSSHKVRGIRMFNDPLGSYVEGVAGPAGGVVVKKVGIVCYESSPADLSSSVTWSNIINVLIGTTLDAIGEGQNNTNEIIAQAGHVDSAAKLCTDYIS